MSAFCRRGALSNLTVNPCDTLRRKCANQQCERVNPTFSVQRQYPVKCCEKNDDMEYDDMCVDNMFVKSNLDVMGGVHATGDIVTEGNSISNACLISNGDAIMKQNVDVMGGVHATGDIVTEGNSISNACLISNGDAEMRRAHKIKRNLIVGNCFRDFTDGSSTDDEDLPNNRRRGDVIICGQLLVKKEAKFEKDVFVCGTLHLESGVSVSGDLSVDGKVSLSEVCVSGDLSVDGKVSLSEVCVSGDLSVDGKVSLSEVCVSGDLSVDGKVSLSEVCVSGDLSVDGKANLSQVCVSGDATVEEDLVVKGDASLVDVCAQSLTVAGCADLSCVQVSEDLHVDGELHVCDDVHVDGELQVCDDVHVDGNLSVHGVTNVDSLNVDGLVSEQVQRLSVAASGAANPSNGVRTVFIETSGTGADATGSLVAGTVDGQAVRMVAVSVTVDYVLDAGSLVDGASTLSFTAAGQAVELVWDQAISKWLVLSNNGVTVA